MVLNFYFQNCPAYVSLAVPQEAPARALLCVADDEGVGCALAASVSGFFSSVAMALKPTEQGDTHQGVHHSKRKAQWEELSADRNLQWGP